MSVEVSDHWKNTHVWGFILVCLQLNSSLGWYKPGGLTANAGIVMEKLAIKKGRTTANAS